MYGLSFESLPAIEPAHPARSDIALFIGWTTRRAGVATPRAIADWLRAHGHAADESLLGVPVPIDAWNVFDALFDWHARPLGDGRGLCDDYLGLGLRDYFANGGRKAYVLRLGEPWPLWPQIDGAAQQACLEALLPSAADSGWQSQHWRGIERAWSLDDVSLVLVPDLPDLLGSARADVPADALRLPPVAEVFVECAPTLEPAPPVGGVRGIGAARLNDAAFEQWNQIADALRARLALRRRDVMLLLAAPLASADSRAARDWAQAITLRSSMLQIALPWLRPAHPPRVPEGLLPPDGALAGLVAASVLARGVARSVAGAAPQDVAALHPPPPEAQLLMSTANGHDDDNAWLQRFSVFAPTPDGVRLRSDRSASARPEWADAGVVRLLGALLRSARQIGQTLVFEPSGEALWARLRGRFVDLLTRWWQAGALRGASADEAFTVECDRSTMSQSDLDQGRVVVRVGFVPQRGIERLQVALALAEDGSVQWNDAVPTALEASP